VQAARDLPGDVAVVGEGGDEGEEGERGEGDDDQQGHRLLALVLFAAAAAAGVRHLLRAVAGTLGSRDWGRGQGAGGRGDQAGDLEEDDEGFGWVWEWALCRRRGVTHFLRAEPEVEDSEE